MLKLVVLFAILAISRSRDPLMENPNLFEGDIAGNIKIDFSRGLGQIPTSSYEKWPSGIVYYTISNVYTTSEVSNIQAGMKAIEDQTRVNGKNCITFTPRTTQSIYLAIQKTGGGCYSYVGKRRTAGAQTLSLDNGCLHTMTVSHELMHALGFFHEQSRPDRDTHVIIDLSVVDAAYHNNFQKYTTGVDLANTPYDLFSIMHYDNKAFSNDRNKNSVTARNGTVLVHTSQKSRLTNIDALAIQRYYGCA